VRASAAANEAIELQRRIEHQLHRSGLFGLPELLVEGRRGGCSRGVLGPPGAAQLRGSALKSAAVTAGVVFAVLAVCFVVGSVMSMRREPVVRAGAPSDPETRFLDTRSGRVHILDVGEGPVVLLMHGTGRSVADWQEGLADRLSERHRVVGFDYYGHGLSDRAHRLRYGPALWVQQAVDVLDALGIERVSVIGHSVGGSVAAMFTADHPDRVERTVFIGHGMAMDPMQWVPFVPGLGEISLGRTEIFSDVFSEEHARRLAAAYEIRGTRAALLTYIRRQYTIDGIRLVLGTYEDIAKPVLQVHGSRDASIPIEAARGLTPRLRDARFVTVEGASHDVHIDAPDELVAAIEAFERETGSAQAGSR
jgi:pimeloyl-ACP methyl ester carboxylesterase